MRLIKITLLEDYGKWFCGQSPNADPKIAKSLINRGIAKEFKVKEFKVKKKITKTKEEDNGGI